MSRCRIRLSNAGQSAPRTCELCQLGPCKFGETYTNTGPRLAGEPITFGLPQSVPVGHSSEGERKPAEPSLDADFASLRKRVSGVSGDGRSRSIALTKLDEALLWVREAERQG